MCVRKNITSMTSSPHTKVINLYKKKNKRGFLDYETDCEMDPSYSKLVIVSPIDRSISSLQQESQHSCSGIDGTDVSQTETGYDLNLYVTEKIISDCIWH